MRSGSGILCELEKHIMSIWQIGTLVMVGTAVVRGEGGRKQR